MSINQIPKTMNTLKNRIAKALETTTSGGGTKTRVIINHRSFIVLYAETLTECIHGDYDDKAIFVYNSEMCKDIYKRDLKKDLPDMVVIVM